MIININKSYSLITLVLVAHAGAFACLLAVNQPWWILTVTGLMILASLFRLVQRGMLSPQGVWRIREDGTCLGPSLNISTESDSWRIIEATRYPGWVRLQLRSRGLPVRTLLILRDAVDSEAFREICARIEQRRLPVVDQPAV
jgi:hypothetical protein